MGVANYQKGEKQIQKHVFENLNVKRKQNKKFEIFVYIL